jgi:hypothetical protein
MGRQGGSRISVVPGGYRRSDRNLYNLKYRFAGVETWEGDWKCSDFKYWIESWVEKILESYLVKKNERRRCKRILKISEGESSYVQRLIIEDLRNIIWEPESEKMYPDVEWQKDLIFELKNKIKHRKYIVNKQNRESRPVKTTVKYKPGCTTYDLNILDYKDYESMILNLCGENIEMPCSECILRPMCRKNPKTEDRMLKKYYISEPLKECPDWNRTVHRGLWLNSEKLEKIFLKYRFWIYESRNEKYILVPNELDVNLPEEAEVPIDLTEKMIYKNPYNIEISDRV